ncbi:SusC/RagA family TonB-linked outer membrane protein [Hymenobacter sp. UV11]|uniref:SusC/RagA family TonB-linked outer membrane protein n=1 Tax=Hymenobacter sp. UV11 TaxID=1849735 RepID=UPI0010609C9D|nr:SusC/RagA family TonB-linked outer membrane protein [Hymenobacter sp. UV11]TDN40578.1 SusC/RagA family TonB-linked outer membrane protein [Hymenobacter sp. UV11]TFZ66405.1 SusC/RagA family TonB-linked outer membrane protein [Hymenobacter sp. UV11]
MKNSYKQLAVLALLGMAPRLGLAQGAPLGGVVTDDAKQPLPGVTVLVKGTTRGTTTGSDGRFNIEAKPGEVLEFRMIGSTTQDVPVGEQRALTVALRTDLKALDEVVVTALGVKKETRKIGYAVQEVSGAAITQARDPNPISGLTGKVAGLSVGPSAELLRAPNVLLRGNTLSLYVVDGFPIDTDTWNISPDDIETYTVLKGPAAAALYGNRAQNGAILITTKKGNLNKKGFTVELNSSNVIQSGFLAFPRLQDSYGPGENTFYTFVDGKGGAPGGVDGDYDVWGPYFNGQLIPQYDSPVVNGVRQGTPWVARGANNLKNFLRPGFQTNNNIALSANGDNYTTRFSVSQQTQNSYIPNNGLNIVNFNLYGSFNPTPRFKIEANLNFNRQFTDNFPDVDYGPNSLIYSSAVWTGADWDVNAPDIRGIWQPGKVGTQSVFAEYQRYHNPWLMVEKWTRGHYKNDTYGYLTGNYKLDEHLNLTLRTQISTYSLLRTEKMPYSAHPYGREGNLGDYREDRRNLFDNNAEGFLSYNYQVGRFLGLSGLVGANVRNMTYNSNWTSTDYLTVPEVYAFSNSLNPVQSTSFNSQMRVLSAYYSLDAALGKYATLSATGRVDRSSAFQTPTTYFYPSVSVAAVLSDYISLPTAISFLKVRGSYANVRADATSATIGPAPFNSITALSGQTLANSPGTNPLFYNPLGYGNVYASPYNGPDYSLQSFYSVGKPYNNQAAGSGSDNLFAQNLKTTTRVNYEEGVDIKFLQNRLGLSATAFQYIDGPRILPNTISTATGFTTEYINALKTKKTGYEVSLTGTPVRTPSGFSWDVLVNYATYKEVYNELPAGQSLYQTFFAQGDRTDKFYGTAFVRNAAGQIINDAAGKPLTNPVLQNLGNLNSTFTWSFFNDFHYKSVGLNFQFDGAVGGVTTDYMFNKTMRGGRNSLTAEGALGAARYQDWQNYGVAGYKGSYVGEGVVINNGASINYDSQTGKILNPEALQYSPNTQVAFVQDYVSKYYNVQESNLMSKTYGKLRQVIISYELPGSLLAGSFIQKVSVSLIGRNLLYFYADKRFKDVDLDQYNGAVSVTGLQSPTVRSYGLNLKATF